MSDPWIVLNALVMRGDTLPDDDIRTTRPHYFVNRGGEGVGDPGVRDRTPALCDTAQLEWEAFDAYWRKVHGPKLIHDEGPDDDVTRLLVFYLQQHRISSGPSSDAAPPYAAQVDTDGRLVGDPEARVAPYTRPRFDGMAQLAFATKADLLRFFDADATDPKKAGGKYSQKIVPDERVFIKGFAFHLCEEHVVIESEAARRDPVLLIKSHTRHPALSRMAFRELWRGSHADLVQSRPAAKAMIRRYTQLHNVSEPGDSLYDEAGDAIDGISVTAFANMNDLEDFLASAEYDEIARDEADFCGTEFYTAINHVIRDASAGR